MKVISESYDLAKTVAIAGLLHDMHKPISREGNIRHNVSMGKEIREKLVRVPKYVDKKLLVSIVKCHHLKNSGCIISSEFTEETMPYYKALVSADWIVSAQTREKMGMDKSDSEEMIYDRVSNKMNLLSVVTKNIKNKGSDNSSKRTDNDISKIMIKSDRIWLDAELDTIFDKLYTYEEITSRTNKKLMKEKMKNSAKKAINEMFNIISENDGADFLSLTSKLDYVLFKYGFMIPDATWFKSKDKSRGDNLPIVSLYSHSTMVAAVGYALAKDYETGVISEEELNNINKLKDPNLKAFTLIVGDLHGIQNFVKVVNKGRDAYGSGVLKRLSGKSAIIDYLTLFSAIDILKELDLPWQNMITISGGRFTILSYKKDINTKAIEERLNDMLGKLTNWTVSITVWSNDVSAEKLKKFVMDEDEMHEFLQYRYNHITKTPNVDLKERPICKFCNSPLINGINTTDESMKDKICLSCKLSEEVGTGIRRMAKDKIAIDSIDESKYVGAYQKFAKFIKSIGVNSKLLIKENVQNHMDKVKYIYLLGYRGIEVPENILKKVMSSENIKNYIYSLDGLERLVSGGKIAYAKGDIDNLGHILLAGGVYYRKIPEDAIGPFKIDLSGGFSIALYKEFSKMLEVFMKYWLPVNILEEKKFGKSWVREKEGKIVYTSMLDKGDTEGEPFDSVAVIYAGGDDFFIVGAWDAVLATQEAMYNEWKKAVSHNPELTYSDAIEITRAKKPVYQALEVVDEKLYYAKNKDNDRNKIWIFGKVVPHENLKDIINVGMDLYNWANGTPPNESLSKVKLSPTKLYNIHKIANGTAFSKTIKDVISKGQKVKRVISGLKLSYLFRDVKPELKEKVDNYWRMILSKVSPNVSVATSIAILKNRRIGGG